MNIYEVTISAIGQRKTILVYGKNKHDAEKNAVARFEEGLGIKRNNMIVHGVKTKPNWICAVWKHVLNLFHG